MGVQVFVLKPHETRTCFPMATYAVGVHQFAVTAEAVAMLSSLFAKVVPVGATAQVKHFYYVDGNGSGAGERVERQATATVTNATAPLTASVIVNQFHHTIRVELIITGSPVECAVMVTPGSFAEGSSGGPSSDVNILGQPIQVTVENAAPIAVEFDQPVNVSVVDPVVIDDTTPINVALVTPNPLPVTGTVIVAQPIDVEVITPIVIDDTTPIQVQVQEPVDVVVTTPVIIDDSTPVQVTIQEPIDVVVTTPVVIDDSTPIEVNFLENIRQQMLKDPLLERAFTWLDFGTKNQRISTIVYTSTNLPTNTVTRTFSYTLVGTRYRLDTDEWVTI